LLIGSIFRKVQSRNLLYSSFILTFIALIIFRSAGSIIPAAGGLFLLGAGLAASFPTMLGLTGNRYPDLSGTAFSFVLVIALLGNMIINYAMGQVAEHYGIRHLTTFTIGELFFLIIIATIIFRRLKHNT
jgi:FHS family glucose/mannose:H+ symporter-like MFS transporter